MEKHAKIINRLLLYGLFFAGVILLFHGTGRVSTMLTAFGSFAASVIAAWLFKIKKIQDKYLLYVNMTLWINLFGEIFFYYYGLFVYDKILHLGLGILLSYIIYDYYKNNSELKKDAVFFTVMGLLAVWEIYEYCLVSFFGFQVQGVVRNGVFLQSAIDDTMYDLIWGAIGSLSYLFFKKEKMDVIIKKDIEKIKGYANKKINRSNEFKKVMVEMFGLRI